VVKLFFRVRHSHAECWKFVYGKDWGIRCVSLTPEEERGETRRVGAWGVGWRGESASEGGKRRVGRREEGIRRGKYDTADEMKSHALFKSKRAKRFSRKRG